MQKITKIVLVDSMGEAVYSDVRVDVCSGSDVSWSYKRRNSFSKVYRNVPDPYVKAVYNGYFYSLMKLVEVNTNFIVVRKGSGYELASASDFASVLGVSMKTVRRFLNVSVERRVMASVRVGDVSGFIANPAYCFNGRRTNPTLYLLFKDDAVFMQGLGVEDRKYLKTIFPAEELNE